MGRFWSAAAPEIVAGRSRVLLGALSSERASMVAEMAECIGATAKMEGELGGVLRKMRGAMQEHHAALGARMEAMETAKMDREAALDSAVGEVDAALRGHDRLEQRLKVKLDGAVSRACARVDDAQTLVHRAGAAAHEAVDRCAALESDLAETRLDALRVRCVTLGHEKANLGEHMELLEEHLERLKADLDQKQAEVAEVEHQWSQTKARLPALKHKHKDAEKLRAALADLAKKLKAHAKAQAKGAGLPRALLQHLDPMERQALEDL
ncbi:hypothetical protein M885DRAFT_549430 [Pelagophyceae sp. CCMP2097]|nr:hypothetical protein M885DRAFT_549430 [Pelagophyceae sp. CCMP2097]